MTCADMMLNQYIKYFTRNNFTFIFFKYKTNKFGIFETHSISGMKNLRWLKTCDNDFTWAPWLLKSPANHCFSNSLFQLTTMNTSKLHITDSLWGQSTSDKWIPCKGPIMQKCFPVITSSWASSIGLLLFVHEEHYNGVKYPTNNARV